MDEEPGSALAHHLGRALQLTNILRDIDEDARSHRLYLPREFLVEAGIEAGDPANAISEPGIDRVCRKVASLAHDHYREAKRVMASRPRGRIRTPKLIGAVYSQILSEMEKTGWLPPRHRVSLGKLRLLGIVITDGLLA